MKQLICTIALSLGLMTGAHAASVINLGQISNFGPQTFAFAPGFDFHSISFEVADDGVYRFSLIDLEPVLRTVGSTEFGPMREVALDLRKTVVTPLDTSVGGGGFERPTSNSATFDTHLDASQRYVGTFVGFAAQGTEVGQIALSISSVPVPASVLLLASALGGLVLVRRRRTPVTPAPTLA